MTTADWTRPGIPVRHERPVRRGHGPGLVLALLASALVGCSGPAAPSTPRRRAAGSVSTPPVEIHGSAKAPTPPPAISRTILPADPNRPTSEIGVLQIDPHQVRLRLLAGSLEPAGAHGDGMVPATDRPVALAAFNSGFKMSQSRGGWYSEGVTAVPLRPGAASLVLRSDGTADVGTWGLDVSMGPTVTAVRQNLTLLIDKGAPTTFASAADFEGLWGKTIHHLAAVSRSGIGITASGKLVYLAGTGLLVGDLVGALLRAGAQRAMELDINPQFVDAYTYAPGSAGPIGLPLVPSLRYGPSHYLQPQARDFIEVLAR